MSWKVAFPEYAVKQAFHEMDIDRGDEHIITAMQSDLLPRTINCVLKGAIIHCIANKRKFMNEKDIEIGRSTTIFPAKDPPESAGQILDIKEFPKLIEDHTKLCCKIINKNIGSEECEIKISNETLIILQNLVESNIRGFVHKLAEYVKNSPANLKNFETVMGKVLGDSSYVGYDEGYITYTQ